MTTYRANFVEHVTSPEEAKAKAAEQCRVDARLCRRLGCAAAKVGEDGWCDRHRPDPKDEPPF